MKSKTGYQDDYCYSIGLPKSASTLIFNCQKDLLAVSDQPSGLSVMRTYPASLYVETFCTKYLLKLLYVNFRFGSIVVKSHASPSNIVRVMLSIGIAKATYTYRDPRDIVLSAIDHGNRSRESGNNDDAFVSFVSICDSIPKVKRRLQRAYAWKSCSGVHFMRYENIVDDLAKELQKMVDFLGWQVSESDIFDIVGERMKNREKQPNFNTGKKNRYRVEMTEDELISCNTHFERFLQDFYYK